MTTIKELQAIAKGRGPGAKKARQVLIMEHSLINSIGSDSGRKKKRNDPEAKEQSAYLDRLKWERPVVWSHTFSVPNERASKGEAGRMKALGVKSGIPDLLCVLPSPDGRWPGVAMEFKAPGREREARGGRTPAQVEWGDRLEAAGWCYAVVYSADQALAVMEEYMMEASNESE